MKLFENGVGRPSNEVLRKRKIVTLSIVTGVIAFVAILIGGITLLVSNSNINSLKGATVNTFSIVYDSNGGTGTMENQAITPGTSAKLNKNRFSKRGKIFEGWIAKRIVNGQELYRGCKKLICQNNSADWISQSSIKSYYIYKNESEASITAKVGETVTMIAKWKGERFPQKTNSTKTVVTTTKQKGGNIVTGILKGLFDGIVQLFNVVIQIKPITTRKTTMLPITTVTKTTSSRSAANDNIKEIRYINKEVCSFPFSTINCAAESNNTVKKIQEMLKKMGYSLNVDGYYGEETMKVVTQFQKANNITTADGVVGYKELLEIVSHKKIKQPYFIVEYHKGINGKDTKIMGTSEIIEDGETSIYQVVLKGIGDKVPYTRIEHNAGANHIGYVASKNIGNDTYYFGCVAKACNFDGSKWVQKSIKEKNEDIFTYYYYNFGDTLKQTAENGKIVHLTASFCDNKLDNACKENFVYYDQNDYRQAFCGRNDGTIQTSGCGTTSMAMILSTLVDKKYGPLETMNEAYEKGYCGSGIIGTDDRYFEYAAKQHGLTYKFLGNSKNSLKEAKAILKRGGLIIANVDSSSPFTSGTHFIVIRKIDSKGNVYVGDPNHQELFDKAYNFDNFVNKGWLYGKGMFAFEVKK